MQPRSRDETPPQIVTITTSERERERDDLDRAEAERERVDQPGEQHDGGDQEHGHLRGRRQGDLRRELDLAAVGDDHRAAVLRRVPDDRDDHGGDEEVRQMDLLGERLERADEDLGDERRHDGRDAERGERRLERPGLDLLVARDVDDVVAAQRVDRDDGVDDEERDRDRHREVDDPLGVRVARSSSGSTGSGRARSRARSSRTRGSSTSARSRRRRRRRARSRARAAGSRRRIRSASRGRPRSGPRCTAIRAMISSGALPNVALRNPPIPGPCAPPHARSPRRSARRAGSARAAESTKRAVSPRSVR